MPVTKIGFVFYADDPTQSVFRMVYPTFDDSELDDPRWVTEGLDPKRWAMLARMPIDSQPQFVSSPATSVLEAINNVADIQASEFDVDGADFSAIQNAARSAAQQATLQKGATPQDIAQAAKAAAIAVAGS